MNEDISSIPYEFVSKEGTELFYWRGIYWSIAYRDNYDVVRDVDPYEINIVKNWDKDQNLNVGSCLEDTFGRYNFSYFVRYKMSCLACSEDNIKKYLEALDPSSDEDVKYFYQYSYNRRTLASFWLQYALRFMNIRLKIPYFPVNFSFGRQEDDDDKRDIWVYGLNTAFHEGSIEAMEYFWTKLCFNQNLDEIEGNLINLGLNNPLPSDYDEYKRAYVIKFVLKYLSDDGIRTLAKKDYEENGFLTIMVTLSLGSQYYEIIRVIRILGTSGLTLDSYFQLLRHSIIDKAPATFILTYNLWYIEGFDNHKEYFLDNIILIDIIKYSNEQMLDSILSSMSEEQIMRNLEEYREHLFQELFRNDLPHLIVRYFLNLGPMRHKKDNFLEYLITTDQSLKTTFTLFAGLIEMNLFFDALTDASISDDETSSNQSFM